MSSPPSSLSVDEVQGQLRGQLTLAVPTSAHGMMAGALAITAIAMVIGITASGPTSSAVAFAVGFFGMLTGIHAGRRLFNPPAPFSLHPTRFVMAGEDLPRTAIRAAHTSQDDPRSPITLTVERHDGIRHHWQIDGRRHQERDIRWLAAQLDPGAGDDPSDDAPPPE